MKTRIIAFFTALLIISGALTGCAAAEPSVLPVRVEGSIFGGNPDDSIAAELKFSPEWLTKGKNTSYSKDLAAFSALICADVYFRAKDLDRGTQNRVLVDSMAAEEYSQTALLEKIGFSDAEYIESYKAKEYTADTNDSVTLTLGHMCDEKNHDIYVAVIRGCFSAQEWMSVFDHGAAGDGYTSRTGAHTEWENTDVLKGTGIAAARAEDFINEFIAAHDDPEKQNCILITGHSRGGMIAEIVGAGFEKKDGFRSFTYTFNASPVTSDPAAADYRTVFNIFDTNDFFCRVFPFGNEKMYRYGKDMTCAVSDSDDIKAAITQIKGRDDSTSVDAGLLAEYENMFGRRFPDRASLYEAKSITETFGTEEAAAKRAEEYRTLISSDAGLGLELFCRAGDVVKNADGTFSATLEYCGGALIWGYCKILAYGADAYAAFGTLFRGDADGCRIADFLSDNAAGISGGHLLVNSYVLTGFVG